MTVAMEDVGPGESLPHQLSLFLGGPETPENSTGKSRLSAHPDCSAGEGGHVGSLGFIACELPPSTQRTPSPHSAPAEGLSRDLWKCRCPRKRGPSPRT